jgi:hypothetical protein
LKVFGVNRMFSVLGPHAEELVLEWGRQELASLEELRHKVVAYNGAPVIAFRESGLGPTVPGWTFILDEPVAADFWRKAALKVRRSILALLEVDLQPFYIASKHPIPVHYPQRQLSQSRE